MMCIEYPFHSANKDENTSTSHWKRYCFADLPKRILYKILICIFPPLGILSIAGMFLKKQNIKKKSIEKYSNAAIYNTNRVDEAKTGVNSRRWLRAPNVGGKKRNFSRYKNEKRRNFLDKNTYKSKGWALPLDCMLPIPVTTNKDIVNFMVTSAGIEWNVIFFLPSICYTGLLCSILVL